MREESWDYMSLSSQSTHQKFPFPYGAVFDALVAAIVHSRFRLNSQDKLIGRISASTNVSLFSYGENLTIRVEKQDETNTLVMLESGLKVGINLAGSPRHARNFDTIIGTASSFLQTGADCQSIVSTAKPHQSISIKRIAVALGIWLGVGIVLTILMGLAGLI